MPSASYGGPKLPSTLLSQINVDILQKRGARNGRQPNSRRARRQLGRIEKRHKPRQTRRHKEWMNDDNAEASADSDEDQTESGIARGNKPPAIRAVTAIPSSRTPSTKTKQTEIGKIGSLERPNPFETVKRSKTSAQDDDDIAALEKKLGIKSKKKLPSAFEQDGLDILLEGLDTPDDAVTGSKSDDGIADDWLRRKRRKFDGIARNQSRTNRSYENSKDPSEDDDADSRSSTSDSDVDRSSQDFVAENMGHDLVEFDGFKSDTMKEEFSKRNKENPYVAPGVKNEKSEGRYIPPSKRELATADAELTGKLRRQIQGPLNRLSESNMISILNDVEKIYQEYPRQYVTSTLVDLLLSLICDRTALMETFLILHAGFAAAVYRTIGVDFGAQIVERLVQGLDQHYSEADTVNSPGKEVLNLITVLSYLYNFQAIGCNMIFDYVREFLKDLSEVNTELLLRIVRSSGQQLRQDDPAALKDLVYMLQKKVSGVDPNTLSARTKFMIETIQDLKNNKTRNGPQSSAITSEHAMKIKKILGSLSNRPSLMAREALNVSLRDIRDTERRGKWWLVGASWKGKGSGAAVPVTSRSSNNRSASEDEASGDENIEADLMQLARENRMNTDIRRAIFVAIMSASDYKDAHARLTKLHLSRNQEQEIPRILLQCVGMEQRYNPYYTLLAQKLCSVHRSRMAFQFALWDLIKRMGDGNSQSYGLNDEQDNNSVEIHAVINYAKLCGHLIASKHHSLSLLKNLDLVYLKPKTKVFVEVLLLTTLLRYQKKTRNRSSSTSMISIIEPIRDLPELAAGLQIFLKKHVSHTDLVDNTDEFALVRRGCKEMRHAIARSMQDVIAEPMETY